MTKITERPVLPANVIKQEFGPESGYERATVSCTVAADTQVGAVLLNTAGTYAPVTALDTADLSGGLAILVDIDVYEDGAGTAPYACLVGGVGGSGAATVGDTSLSYAEALSDPQKDLVYAQLNAQGIRVGEQKPQVGA